MFGKNDPYATLSIGSETYTTKVHNNGGNRAKWNEQFEL